jgi:hypothetical protein
MREDDGTVAGEVLIEPDAGASLGQHGCERRLADFERIAPQVVAVQLDQVERVEEHARIVAAVADAIEDATPFSPQATLSVEVAKVSRTEAVLKHFQARMPHGLGVPDVKPDTDP